MLRIRIELISANTGKTTELARMDISNDGKRTIENNNRGTYEGRTYRGRNETLERGIISRKGIVENYPRQALHVWNLVVRMLHNMGYE